MWRRGFYWRGIEFSRGARLPPGRGACPRDAYRGGALATAGSQDHRPSAHKGSHLCVRQHCGGQWAMASPGPPAVPRYCSRIPTRDRVLDRLQRATRDDRSRNLGRDRRDQPLAGWPDQEMGPTLKPSYLLSPIPNLQYLSNQPKFLSLPNGFRAIPNAQLPVHGTRVLFDRVR